jgi:tRNA-2-methylthio-N6-dimethylallyladenosine synthase
MNRVYIKTYGCQMNERDSDAVAMLLRQRGYDIVGSELDADVVLLNTCSVRDQAEQKAIGKAGFLSVKGRRRNPNLVVGVMGCMAQNRGADLLDRLPDLDLVVGTQKFHRVPDHLENILASRQGRGPKPSTILDLDEEIGSQNEIKHHQEVGKPTAFVSIMQGCNMRCAFCIVPKTRGAERSRPMDDIVREVEELAAKGTREITLLGQIVTSYGRKEFPFRNGKSPFVQLLERIHEVDGIARIRFTSPHPRGFKRDLIDCYRDLPKLCEYVHLPLQSGSDRILRLMNRPYSAKRYRQIIDDLREVQPNLYVSTDVIVGFPGETEEDFQETYKMFQEIRYDMAYVFKYSPRSGTPAAEMEDHVSAEAKEARNQALLDVLSQTSLARNEGLVGKVEEVLIEGPARKGNTLMGRNRGNRTVILPGPSRLIGQLIPVRYESATVSAVYGTPVIA